jgi:hypothetical protein
MGHIVSSCSCVSPENKLIGNGLHLANRRAETKSGWLIDFQAPFFPDLLPQRIALTMNGICM